MKLAEISIKRPVFTTMVIAAIVVFGGFLYFRIPVDLLPDVDPPIVTITTIYPGASPETMESQVTEPIEEALGTLGGIRILRSVCLESVSQVIVEFELEVDLNASVQDVRDRIASISHNLPENAEQPIVEKLDLGAEPIFQLAVTGDTDPAEMSRYVDEVLRPGLQQINGVGQVQLVGDRGREVHVWLDPNALRAHGTTAVEVAQALGAQNLEVPGGLIRRGSQELNLRTDARATSIEELEGLAIATIPMSGVIRLGDLARIEDGLEEQRSDAEFNGQSAIAIVIRKQSGQNTVVVASQVLATLPRLASRAPPGTDVRVLLDGSNFIRSSVESVELDLVIGAFLAVAIIFVFLRDPRATLISALALPTSVIGTFAFIAVMGFTINTLTTLALSLSIGILIDDAIVVIENIARHRTALGESPRDAAYRGTAEIGLAVVATTLSLVAVFIPVAFTQGLVGKYLVQFGLTVAFSVLLSLFVSFTLTPMLASRLLSKEEKKERGLYAMIGRALDGLDHIYRKVIAWVLRHRIIAITFAIASLASAALIAPLLGMELLPSMDRGQFSVKIELSPGTSFESTTQQTRQIAEELRQIPGVESTFSRIGGGVMGQANASEILVTLVPRSEREYSEGQALSYIRRQFAGDEDRIINVDPINVFGGSSGRMSPIEVILSGNDLDELAATATRLVNDLEEIPGFVDIDTTIRGGKPEIKVEVDRPLAADLGILGAPLAMTVRILVAGQVVTRLDREGESLDVRVQLPPEHRSSADAISMSQVRTPTQELIDIATVAHVFENTGPNRIDRFNQRRQVTLYANLEGLAQSDAMAMVSENLDRNLPETVNYEFGGIATVLNESITGMAIALILAIICIYMVLASQFESFIHPVTIMVSLPFSAIGAFLSLLVFSQTISIFAMIGFVMLMGLVTKNAILLVEFANQKRKEGLDLTNALIEAGATRLRPILMTTAATIFGMLPAATGHGDGGEMRMGMGIAVIGGLMTSTLLTLLIVPVFYTLMDGIARSTLRILKKIFSRQKPSSKDLAQESSVTH